MTKSIKSLVAAIATTFALLPLSATAAEYETTFSYDKGNGTTSVVGTSKKEHYDVAILLEGKGLEGAKVKSVRVPLTGVGNISGLKVWLSTTLALKTEKDKQNKDMKVADADILTQEADAADGLVEVELATPYTMTGDDVYVGYSFDVDELDDSNGKPIWVTTEDTGAEGGLMMHTSRTYRSWKSLSTAGCSILQVVLSGISTNAAAFGTTDELCVKTGEASTIDLDVVNYGAAGISSFDYTYEIAGQTGSAHVDLGEEPVSAILGNHTTHTVSIPAIADKGTYTLRLTVTKVNGEANEYAHPSTDMTVNAYNYLPKHRAVMEEYTGTWCGWCPRGFVALEVMKKLHPDDFIAISYHNSDIMEIMSYYDFPSSISGFPSACIDRLYSVDPFYGSGSKNLGIEDTWKSACETFAHVGVDVAASLNEDNTKVSVAADLIFCRDFSSIDYEVEFVLLADDLHGDDENWDQSNYYANSDNSYGYTEFDKFTSGGSEVSGLHFDDVIIATTRLTGGNAAVPSDVESDKAYSVSGEFAAADLVNTSGTSLVQDLSKLRAVALVVDNSTGAIINANMCDVALDPAGISILDASAQTGKAKIYDLSGRRVERMAKGVNIVKTADGRAIKVLKK